MGGVGGGDGAVGGDLFRLGAQSGQPVGQFVAPDVGGGQQYRDAAPLIGGQFLQGGGGYGAGRGEIGADAAADQGIGGGGADGADAGVAESAGVAALRVEAIKYGIDGVDAGEDHPAVGGKAAQAGV